MKAENIEGSAGVRYWEDGDLNGVADSEGRMPFKLGDRWCPVIRISDGAVICWPDGFVADVHYKVCDEGEYWLLDADKRRIAKWSGDYVPDRWLCPRSSGCGDYIIMSIGADGKVVGWKAPAVEDWKWGAIPQPMQDFEQWLTEANISHRCHSHDSARLAWTAATAAERERCAALVDGNYGWRQDTNAYCDNLADAIRGTE